VVMDDRSWCGSATGYSTRGGQSEEREFDGRE